MDRKAFFRSIQPRENLRVDQAQPHVTRKGSASQGSVSLDRKGFLRALGFGETTGQEAATTPAEPVETSFVTIRFSLQALKNFKAQSLTSGGYRQEKVAFRKRPSYNNSKRKLLAKPQFRVK